MKVSSIQSSRDFSFKEYELNLFGKSIPPPLAIKTTRPLSARPYDSRFREGCIGNGPCASCLPLKL